MSSSAEAGKVVPVQVERDNCPPGSISSEEEEEEESERSVNPANEHGQDSIVEEIYPSPKNCRITPTSPFQCSPKPPACCSTVATTATTTNTVIVNKFPSGYLSSRRQPVDSQSCLRATADPRVPSGKQPPAEVDIGDSGEITTIREFTSEQSTSISGVLRFCKRRILFPYLKLLGVMGLKPLYTDTNDACVFTLVMSRLYVILVGLVLLMGYTLHFMTCFRRDHGFSYKDNITNPPFSTSLESSDAALPSAEINGMWGMSIGKNLSAHSYNPFMHKTGEKEWLLENIICKGNVIYVYAVPSTFHFLSFLYMVRLYWVNDDEHLQNLMERVFIQAAHANVNVFSQKRLVRRLQGLVGMGCVWIIITTGIQILQVFINKVYINVWVEADFTTTNTISALLLFSTLWQDAIQVTVVISFGIHCHLICTYTELIRARLLQHSISLSDCMKELGELKQLLRYLNEDLALGLAPLIILDGLYATGSVVYLIQHGKHLPVSTFMTFAVVAGLWISISIFPLTQAAKLSTCCRKLKDMGHMLRIRPFGYQFVTQFDLDSFLLFVSSLNLKVRILKVPITSAMLSALGILVTIVVLLWGYCQ